MGLPRGIPAASLKQDKLLWLCWAPTLVFRGEYPRPH